MARGIMGSRIGFVGNDAYSTLWHILGNFLQVYIHDQMSLVIHNWKKKQNLKDWNSFKIRNYHDGLQKSDAPFKFG